MSEAVSGSEKGEGPFTTPSDVNGKANGVHVFNEQTNYVPSNTIIMVVIPNSLLIPQTHTVNN